MLIGCPAAVAEIPTETIRYHERRGLLAPRARSADGYPTYDRDALHQLGFVRGARAAGLTLTEIASVIQLRYAGTTLCSHVEALLVDNFAEVCPRQRQRQRQLSTLE